MKVMLNSTLLALLLASWVGLSAAADESPKVPESVADVFNIHHPHENHFSAGQPTREQLTAFGELGVVNVVNLRPPSETEDFNPAAWATEETMAYFHIPIASGADLNPTYVGVFNEVLTRIEGEKTLLHCGSGNRVGAMIALRAVWHQDMDLEAAIELGKTYGLTTLERHVREQVEAHQ
ncbi:beta-lactamase hydrolase domain-containing protein [Aliidiomarina sanyensis]|uniref:Serine/threonine protein phosphatase n=1 Tax=Aliidiomarina sanyensis TaxID=1249555 RepID=A0A432WPM7_9GAMM|nr:sulfur transferase domain-containing protein [Aliidiomarina sanyensis]RUO35756.1 serine/threonine protein phosphatase [Aliidiomarina sanyensis]